ncbi:prepilin-type N-terminal cleavage/methylation domain-containing protein [Acinetobacter indicus]|uniref:prepilin-type N-terminal cleavage/methylation domain-containing protein n=1 Tax=Acinetobacter indicus TaxID=756892 RepID=UPI001444824F|nr:prepilin-type N-terminal cleavage/methylation domain-containing protein [Acinetobacter indicus]MDM1281374.1 prepilin-type N-terminal cleavage/methylation domain-containing protein [Acinetobacter indicus]MDM1302238.1 prepilin-type N-terminal cleavage/methylation domain-containing protein [Acinetobacter indicus]QSG83624.1 prepilin-type N-terminal cleavage/methylation domain-containing protein [Acinetobacter indicus]
MHQVHYKSSTMYKHQQGVTLIEVLVSMVLMAIIGLGAAYISGRTAVMHRDQNLHLHTVNQMRQYLESSTGTSCTNNIDIEVAGKKVKVNCTLDTAKEYTVNIQDNSGAGIVTSVDQTVKVGSPTLEIVKTSNSETHWDVPVTVKIAP